MTHKFTLFIGLNDQHTKTQLIASADAEGIITDSIFAAGLGGCTMIPARGGYRHIDGTTITENTIITEICFFGFDGSKAEALIPIKQIAATLKAKLNQESIGYEYSFVDSDLL